jgi:hypothetical protein
MTAAYFLPPKIISKMLYIILQFIIIQVANACPLTRPKEINIVASFLAGYLSSFRSKKNICRDYYINAYCC